MTTASRSPSSVDQDAADVPWRAGNFCLANLSGKLLGARVGHAEVIAANSDSNERLVVVQTY